MSALTPVNIGTIANDGTGDPLRTSFDQMNKNVAALTVLSGAASRASVLATDLSDFVADLTAIRTNGYATEGDGGGAFYKKVGAEPSHGFKMQSLDGAWWEGVPEGMLRASQLGVIPGQSAATNGAGITLLNAYISAGNYKSVWFMPGSTVTDTGLSFDADDLHIVLHSVALQLNATSGVLIDLNSGGGADDSGAENRIRIEGGVHQPNTLAAANTVVGIRVRTTSEVSIQKMRLQNLDVGVQIACREACHLDEVSTYRCNVAFQYPEFFTAANGGNPQDVTLTRCTASQFYTHGVEVAGAGNHLRVRDCFLIPATTATTGIANATGNCVYINTASTVSAFNRNITIEGNDFEQGFSGFTYIKVNKVGSNIARNIMVQGNSFAETAPKICDIEACEAFTFSDNFVVSNQAGWLTFDADCKGIVVEKMRQGSFNTTAWASWPAITYACARSEIHFDRSPWLDSDEGVLTGYDGDSFSTGNDTIDMSVELSEFPGVIAPRGYIVQGTVKDSGSAAAAVGVARLVIARDAATAANDAPIAVDLTGRTNDAPMHFSGYVECDGNGDIRVERAATGANTMDIDFKIAAINMGGKI